MGVFEPPYFARENTTYDNFKNCGFQQITNPLGMIRGGLARKKLVDGIFVLKD